MYRAVNFKVTITEMYSRIPWKLLADPLGSAERTVGQTDLDDTQFANISMLIAAFLE